MELVNTHHYWDDHGSLNLVRDPWHSMAILISWHCVTHWRGIFRDHPNISMANMFQCTSRSCRGQVHCHGQQNKDLSVARQSLMRKHNSSKSGLLDLSKQVIIQSTCYSLSWWLITTSKSAEKRHLKLKHNAGAQQSRWLACGNCW